MPSKCDCRRLTPLLSSFFTPTKVRRTKNHTHRHKRRRRSCGALFKMGVCLCLVLYWETHMRNRHTKLATHRMVTGTAPHKSYNFDGRSKWHTHTHEQITSIVQHYHGGNRFPCVADPRNASGTHVRTFCTRARLHALARFVWSNCTVATLCTTYVHVMSLSPHKIVRVRAPFSIRM